MSNTKRYPTRMHEVLGVEANEDFIVSFPGDGEYQQADFECFVDDGGNFKYKKHPELPPSIHIINYAINHGITRRPRLTEEAQEKEDYIIRLERMRSQKDQWANGKHAHWLEIPADHAKDRDALDAAIEALTRKSRLTEEQVAQLKALVTLLRLYKGGVSI